MKKGFTLIELMVASMLLGILVSILTSLFSQSSIAWTTGTASVVDMNETRKDMSDLQILADNLIATQPKTLYVQSVFQDQSGSKLNQRAVTSSTTGTGSMAGSIDMAQPTSWTGISVGGAESVDKRTGMGNGKGYVVGVWSYGPDGQANTWDDLTTWPAD